MLKPGVSSDFKNFADKFGIPINDEPIQSRNAMQAT
jgi:hypothetical protein